MSRYPRCRAVEITPEIDQLEYELAIYLEWFGALLSRIRYRRMNMDQVQFAKFLGISQARLSQLENGRVDFKISSLLKISAQLGLTPKMLVASRRQLELTASQRGGYGVKRLGPGQLKHMAQS
jgi:plasmid maintenance system antidote protein VapI